MSSRERSFLRACVCLCVCAGVLPYIRSSCMCTPALTRTHSAVYCRQRRLLLASHTRLWHVHTCANRATQLSTTGYNAHPHLHVRLGQELGYSTQLSTAGSADCCLPRLRNEDELLSSILCDPPKPCCDRDTLSCSPPIHPADNLCELSLSIVPPPLVLYVILILSAPPSPELLAARMSPQAGQCVLTAAEPSSGGCGCSCGCDARDCGGRGAAGGCGA